MAPGEWMSQYFFFFSFFFLLVPPSFRNLIVGGGFCYLWIISANVLANAHHQTQPPLSFVLPPPSPPLQQWLPDPRFRRGCGWWESGTCIPLSWWGHRALPSLWVLGFKSVSAPAGRTNSLIIYTLTGPLLILYFSLAPLTQHQKVVSRCTHTPLLYLTTSILSFWHSHRALFSWSV